MAGQKDETKRAAVRDLLRFRQWQAASDRAVAAEAGVSKLIVAEVRRQLIAAGKHPPREPIRGKGYTAGAAARGGYRFAPDGRMVTEVEYLKIRAAELARPGEPNPADLLLQLLAILNRPQPPDGLPPGPTPAPRRPGRGRPGTTRGG